MKFLSRWDDSDCLCNMYLAKAMGNDSLLDTERDKEMKNTIFAFKKITV